MDCAGFLSLILIMNFSDELDQGEPAKSARFPTGTRVCVEFKNSTTLARDFQ